MESACGVLGKHMSKKRRGGKEGKFTTWWNGKRDMHLRILSSIFLSSIAIIISSLVHLLLLRPDPAWSDYTTLAWSLLGLSTIIAIWIGPEFVHYVGQYNTLNEVLELEARSEVSKRRADAEAAANLLGSRYQEMLDEHLIKVGLKRSKRS